MENEYSEQTSRNVMDEYMRETEEYVRENPAKAAGLAIGAGLLASLLPIGLLIAFIFKLLLLSVKPILLLAGACKLYEESQKRMS